MNEGKSAILFFFHISCHCTAFYFLIYLLLPQWSIPSGSLLFVLPVLLGYTPRIWIISHCSKRPIIL